MKQFITLVSCLVIALSSVAAQEASAPSGGTPPPSPSAQAPAGSEAPVAKTPATPPPSGGMGALGGFLPIILIFVVFYFLLIMPQQRQRKKHQEMLNALKAGDRVIILGGVYGIITKLRDTTLMVKVAENTEIEIDRGAVSQKLGQTTK